VLDGTVYYSFTHMSHIEFIGPPGAGKSSLYRGLIADSSYSGWDPVAAVRLATPDSLSLVLDRIPESAVRPLCEKVWHYWAMDTLYDDFLRRYPSYQMATETAMSSATINQAKLQWLLKLTAAKFHVASTTSTRNEQVCLDEGFYHRSLSVARRSGWKLPAERYFESIPEPSVIVAVTAPVEVCLERQQERGSVVRSSTYTETEIIKQIHTLTDELCAASRDRGITVVRIRNTGDVTKTLEKLAAAL